MKRLGRCGNLQSSHIAGVTPYAWDAHVDKRGRWQRVWDASRLSSSQNCGSAEQISLSTNPLKGTLRGLHFLDESVQEWKSVVCVQGSVQDVVVDMRESSASFRSHQSFNLLGKNNDGIHIPPGCAHGFLTLEANTILLYVMSAPYDSSRELALRWDDPSLGISWAIKPQLISEKDKGHTLL